MDLKRILSQAEAEDLWSGFCAEIVGDGGRQSGQQSDDGSQTNLKYVNSNEDSERNILICFPPV